MLQVAFPPGNRITIGNKYLELLQFHFHTPSEHALDGRRLPMEVHMVHKDLYTGALAVLAVMLERSGPKDNECLRLALDCAPDVGAAPVRVYHAYPLLLGMTLKALKQYMSLAGFLARCTRNEQKLMIGTL